VLRAASVLDSLRELDWSPRELRKKARLIAATEGKLSTLLGRTATDEEVADAIGITIESYHQLQGELFGLTVRSLEEQSRDNDEEICMYEPEAPEEDPFAACLRSEMKQSLMQAIGELPERERFVLSLYYSEERSLKEIAKALGVVESRVSQIHSAAVARLRVSLGRRLELQRSTDRNHSRRQ